MAEPSLKDRLQPALLDRLTDEERVLTVFRISLDLARLEAAGITEADVERSLGLQGLRRVSEAPSAAGARDYVVAGGVTRAPSAKSLRVQNPKGEPVPLASMAEVEVTSRLNSQLESADRRAMTMTKLREAVLRDLRWLFNATGIDDVVDLEPYPEARRSVINYGLRSLAGKPLSSIDAVEVARRIRDAIRFFEPRLGRVQVEPEQREGVAPGTDMAFIVQAELWSQPVAQQLSLRTSIDLDTGDVVIADRAGRG
jgi:type VI secretion system protein ImpF